MIMKILQFIFGTNKRQVFKRFVIVLVIVCTFIILSVNVGFGCKDGQPWFEWHPADVKVDIKRGQ